MKVYITKYALTEGILEAADAERFEQTSMISVKSMGPFANFHGEGKEWHTTLESAKARAEAMRIKKIAVYKKSIKKLETMKF